MERFLRQAASWAATRDDVVALALVGSRARNDARADSDLDLVLLTDDPGAYTQREDWVAELAPEATLVETRNWGALTERRLRLPTGLEIDVGVGLPSWAHTDPLDDGTRRVVQDGLHILYDPHGLLAALPV